MLALERGETESQAFLFLQPQLQYSDCLPWCDSGLRVRVCVMLDVGSPRLFCWIFVLTVAKPHLVLRLLGQADLAGDTLWEARPSGHHLFANSLPTPSFSNLTHSSAPLSLSLYRHLRDTLTFSALPCLCDTTSSYQCRSLFSLSLSLSLFPPFDRSPLILV